MRASQEKAPSKNMHLSAHFPHAFMVKVLCETELQMDTSALQTCILCAFYQKMCSLKHDAL